MTDWANVATLGKAKNLKGGLLAYAREGLPFLLEEGLEVTFVPPMLRVPRTGRVVSVVNQGGGAYLVHFDSIDSIDLAEKLQAHSCLVRCSDLSDDALDGAVDLIGFTVLDASGEALGKVVVVEENPAHALLVVERAHAGAEAADVAKTNEALDPTQTHDPLQPREARIPLVDAFITAIDGETNTITVDLPEGLLDL